jgi:AraC family transcriptional regulator of adaptative response / methylphosphotriester-DNA alkyltransferase methyltransferase
MTEEQWQAIVACDERYDGRFVYGVATTGVFCQPSCRSKTPTRKNVRLFADAGEARAAGFRPCKRCRPEAPDARPAQDRLADGAAALIARCYAEDLTLAEIARRLFVSPFHLQRGFTRVRQVSPSRYLRQQRISAARALLAESALSVTAVALSVGFKSPAHFSAVFRAETGVSPTAFRQAPPAAPGP